MTATAPYATAVSATLRLRRCWARTIWMALIWLGLNGLDVNSWVVGVPAVLAAAWISVRLLPAISWRWSLRGALVFAAYFIRESVRGGWDVARRVLSPALRRGLRWRSSPGSRIPRGIRGFHLYAARKRASPPGR